MKTFSITYDLRKPGQNYQPLWDRLKALGATKIEESQWLLRSPAKALDLATDLLRSMDGNDRLFVAQVQGDIAWRTLIVGNDSINKILAA